MLSVVNDESTAVNGSSLIDEIAREGARFERRQLIERAQERAT
ncbi:hypothetical protein [Streptomyces sp. NPDC017964]